jgi:small subunit ribosomal protein S20
MPIIKSAKKAAKRSIVLNKRNTEFRLRMKMAIKKFIKSSIKGEPVTQEDVNKIYKYVDKCAKVGIIKKKTAARKKARVARIFTAKKDKSK